jgi:HlyD family secretion protein
MEEQVNVVSEIGGRIMGIAVDEGDSVALGEPIVTLDDAALHAQVKQAEAALSAAEASLAQVKAGTRQEAIDAAEAALQQAQAERVGAALTLSDTLRILDHPQQINAQVDAARSGVALAEQNVAVMQTRLAEARYRRSFYNNDKDKRETLDKEIAIAQKNLEAAQAQLNGARAQFNALQAMRSSPVALQAQVNQARNAYSLALANEAVAAANVSELKAGPTPEEIALAEAKVQQAQASLKWRRRMRRADRLHSSSRRADRGVGEPCSLAAPLSLVNDTLI